MSKPDEPEGDRMTIGELIERARTVMEQEVGRDFWLDLARNKSCDYESCYLCGCDIDSLGTGIDMHEGWCPTLIARRVLGLNVKKPPHSDR